MKPIILTDIDGVALKWQSGLPFFLASNNMPTDVALECLVDEQFRPATELFGCNESLAKMMIEEYNNSSYMRYLAPYTDALIVINRLKARFDFVAVTALGTKPGASLNRIANLNTLFPSAFKEIAVVNHGESKTVLYNELKAKYGDRIVCFVDDLAINLEHCHDVMPDLKLFHMLRGWREDAKCEATCVNDWSHIEGWLDLHKIGTKK
ncbi:haloacid halogenase [Pantoea phage Phynn]|nr:haloacid halogenase [Pantoea phage Phynn]